jgi:hypothetical protein
MTVKISPHLVQRQDSHELLGKLSPNKRAMTWQNSLCDDLLLLLLLLLYIIMHQRLLHENLLENSPGLSGF